MTNSARPMMYRLKAVSLLSPRRRRGLRVWVVAATSRAPQTARFRQSGDGGPHPKHEKTGRVGRLSGHVLSIATLARALHSERREACARKARRRRGPVGPTSPCEGTYLSLVRRLASSLPDRPHSHGAVGVAAPRYVSSQAGLLTQLHRPDGLLSRSLFPAPRQWPIARAPLHSSGPVGDSHSVPYSPHRLPRVAGMMRRSGPPSRLQGQTIEHL